jgi:hypothetical protein
MQPSINPKVREAIAAHCQQVARAARIRYWLAALALASIALAGCSFSQSDTSQEPTTMATEAIVRQWTVKETTLRRLGNNWDLGLQMIYQGQYVDDQGRAQTGPMARISIGNEALQQVETLEVHEGALFQAGAQRFQVLQIKPNTSLSQAPGSSNGYLVVGQLP